MAIQAKTILGVPDLGGLTQDQLLRFYRTMVTSRRIDDREINLKRQNKTFFQVSSAGHEAIGVTIAEHTKPGHDWFFLYYRDRAMALALGQTPLDHFLQARGAAKDGSSGGRQMPSHWGNPSLNIPTSSSPTGTQFLQAVGAAEAGAKIPNIESLREQIQQFEEDEVIIVCTGEGATSEGEFWESLNTACSLSLPVVYVVQDNGYAISVPVEVQTAGGSISDLVSGFPGLHIVRCDGTDLVDSYRAAGEAVAHTRKQRGPSLIHATCTRPYSHSMSDDERAYRSADERAAQEDRDPLRKARSLVLNFGAATDEQLREIEIEITADVSSAADQALASPAPDPATALRHLFSEEIDPTSSDFDTEGEPDYQSEKPLTMVDLLNSCLKTEMARDARIVMFGQDIADASREDVLQEVKGKGGVFKVTYGLQREFGQERVYNAPIAEANIVGRAIGMALRGLRPVVEIQFFDYIWPAMQQIRNELATYRWRSDGNFSVPVVVRVSYGGYVRGGAIYHSQTGETLFAHTPGLHICMPSTAEDANGLLRTAIRCEDPVIFLEHKHLYRQVANKGRDPGPNFMIPFGKAKVRREGNDVTIITCGALVKRSLDAAKIASTEHGIETEVIDLRTIKPLDMERIADSVKKTGKALVVHEDSLSYGVGGEISARVADELFEWLDAPIKRVASLDTWVGYAPVLEDAILPQTQNVIEALKKLAAY
ncbi:MAG: dehydrogenase E1 component subunit alpha/beta [Gemmatimonadetes bacterium]|nr:dehydrogenase E1 component subunit alpha/beta [Gemmatimonadota bacterium]